MKKKDDLDEPRRYFERNIPMIVLVVSISVLLIWISGEMLKNVNPWGTLVAVPGLVFIFQSLWLITNPYAIVYEDRFEIKHSFFYSKTVFFLDLKKISELKGSSFVICYNDDDTERLPLWGIRGSHKKTLQAAIEEGIGKSRKDRVF